MEATHLTLLQSKKLERFISTFLPESITIVRHAKPELIKIVDTILPIFNYKFGYTVTIDEVFKALESQKYAIAVVEPMHPDRKQTPYIETNSGAIYFNISPSRIAELKQLPKHWESLNSNSNTFRIEELARQIDIFNKLNLA